MRAILTYHSIDESGSPISVAPAAFRRHVEWLASGRVRVVSLEEIVRLNDAVDAVALRVLGSPFIRPARLVEHAIFSPDLIGPWVLVEMHERYRVPFVYFQEAT